MNGSFFSPTGRNRVQGGLYHPWEQVLPEARRASVGSRAAPAWAYRHRMRPAADL